MADFPVVAATAVGVTFELTEHTFDLPDGLVLDQRLFLRFSMDDDDGLNGSLTVDSPGYTIVVDNEPLGHFGGVVEMKCLAIEKIITDVDETTVTVTSSNAESVAYIGQRFTDFDATEPIAVAGPVSFGTGFDPPSIDPSWDMAAEGALVMADAYVDPGYAPATGPPSGYSNFSEVHIVHNSGAALATASKQVTAASEDPGAFAFSGSPDVGFFTFAMRPGVDGPGPLAFTLRLSGGAANDDPALSIGGAESSENVVGNELWPDIANAQRLAGFVTYRYIYVHNEDVVDGTVTAFVSQQLEAGREIAIAAAVEGSGEEVDELPDSETDPGLVFSAAETAGTGVNLGTVGADEGKGLCIRLTIDAASAVDITNPWEITVQVTRL